MKTRFFFYLAIILIFTACLSMLCKRSPYDIFDFHPLDPEENPQAVSDSTQVEGADKVEGDIPIDESTSEETLQITTDKDSYIITPDGTVNINVNVASVNPDNAAYVDMYYIQIVGASDYFVSVINQETSSFTIKLGLDRDIGEGSFSVRIAVKGQGENEFSNITKVSVQVMNEIIINPTPTATPTITPTAEATPTPTPTPDTTPTISTWGPLTDIGSDQYTIDVTFSEDVSNADLSANYFVDDASVNPGSISINSISYTNPTATITLDITFTDGLDTFTIEVINGGTAITDGTNNLDLGTNNPSGNYTTPDLLPPCFPNCPSVTWETVPGGTFTMGYNYITPTASVTVSSFEMMAYEVTNAQYDECITNGPCTADNDDGSPFEDADHPVVGLDWQQSRDFCQWIGGDLPTEAQWEYAASWGTGSTHGQFEWALDQSSYEEGGTVSKYCDSIAPGDASATCIVGSFDANYLGLYDMSGNVWEWCRDWYEDESTWYVTIDGTTDPLCNNDASGSRVVRGGSWSSLSAGDFRTAVRVGYDPTNGFNYLGVRCAR